MKSKTTAGLLAIFLGGLGIHQFYLGNGSKGVLYLLFCWTGIPSLIGFIDGIVLLTSNERRFNIKYNHIMLDLLTSTSRSSQPINNAPPGNTADELEKLYKLMEKGVITQEEFNLRKAKLL